MGETMVKEGNSEKTQEKIFVTLEQSLGFLSVFLTILFGFVYFMISEIREDIRHIHTEMREDMRKITPREAAYFKALTLYGIF